MVGGALPWNFVVRRASDHLVFHDRAGGHAALGNSRRALCGQQGLRGLSCRNCAKISRQSARADSCRECGHARPERVRILPRSRQPTYRHGRPGRRRKTHHQSGQRPFGLFSVSPGSAGPIPPPPAPPGPRRPHELRPMPRPARFRHHETRRRAGHGTARSELRPMPSKPDSAICLPARRAAGRLHRLPQSARFHQPENAHRK